MSKHSRFSATGLLARFFELAVKIAPYDAQLIPAAMYGVVELLGAKRFWLIIWPIIQQKLGVKHAGTKQTKKNNVPNLRHGTQRGGGVPKL